MIYLIVYLLDFYPSFISLLMIFNVFAIILYIIKHIIMFITEEDYEYYGQSKDIIYKLGYRWHISAKKFPLKVYCIAITLALSLVLPSSKGLYLLTGLYVGERTLDKVQENPLYNKAYKLAEAKLDELLNEANLKLEGKQNEFKK